MLHVMNNAGGPQPKYENAVGENKHDAARIASLLYAASSSHYTVLTPNVALNFGAF